MRAMRACFLVIALALGATACGGEDESSAPTTAETTTTTEKATTSTDSGCDQALTNLIDTLGTWLDRVEVDPEAASEVPNTDAPSQRMGAECGQARFRSVMSELAVYLAREASNRPSEAGAAAEEILSGLCGAIGDSPIEFELTAQGKTACLWTSNESVAAPPTTLTSDPSGEFNSTRLGADLRDEIEGIVPPEIAVLIESVEVEAGTVIIQTSIGPGEFERTDGHNICGAAKIAGYAASDIEVYSANGDRIRCLP